MKIFYLGQMGAGTTSHHRAEALRRLGHEVDALDLNEALGSALTGPLTSRVHYYTGYGLLQSRVTRLLWANAARIGASDVIWVNGGELLGREAVLQLRALGPKIVLFNNDDPPGGRDGARFDGLIRALPAYDLCVTVRDATLDDFRRLGARRAIRVWMGCDEVVHAPPSEIELSAAPCERGIVFIGTWIRGENRDATLAALIDMGLPISVFGDRWQRSPFWSKIGKAWKGAGLRDRAYTRALVGADACLGFLSAGNRDLYTTRSLEIPYAGGVLIAERTSEHVAMYQEGQEALFWDDAEECAQQCRRVLEDPALSARLRTGGMARARELGVGNEKVVSTILETVMSI